MFEFVNAAVRDPFGHISPTEVESHAPATRIIDVREPHEFYGELGHIPRAELVPLGDDRLASSIVEPRRRHRRRMPVGRSLGAGRRAVGTNRF